MTESPLISANKIYFIVTARENLRMAKRPIGSGRGDFGDSGGLGRIGKLVADLREGSGRRIEELGSSIGFSHEGGETAAASKILLCPEFLNFAPNFRWHHPPS